MKRTSKKSNFLLQPSADFLKIFSLFLIILFMIGECRESIGEYYCPMHPEFTSTKPGNCPICGMKLVLKQEISEELNEKHTSSHSHNDKPYGSYSGADHRQTGKNFIILPAEKQKAIGVKTSIAKKTNTESVLVSSGQVLYNPELYSALVEYREAMRLGNTIGPEFILSAKTKLMRLGLDEQDVRFWALKNPEIFLTGRSGNNAYISTQIFERDIIYLKTSKQAEVRISSYPDIVFSGRIIGWSRLIDEKNRSTQAWLEVRDAGKKLSSRMFTETRIRVSAGNILTVPRSAVIRTGLRDIVYVKSGEDRFRPILVSVGKEIEDRIQILSGLEEGDEVVVSANFLLDSEAKLQLGGHL